MTFPAIFVSHGAPTLIIEDVPARRFLMQLGKDLGTPQAIIVVSAHDIGRKPTVRTAAQLETLHDFGGFPRELYQLEYTPPGEVTALVFVSNPDHPDHVGELPLEETARTIARAEGVMGRNRDYVEQLARQLAGLGIVDPYIARLAAGLQRLDAG